MKTKRYLKSIICLILSLLCVISVVSCVNKQSASNPDGDGTNVGDNGNSGTNTETEEIDAKEFYKPESKTYDRDFVFAGNEFIDYYNVDENFQLEKGSTLQKAAYYRNTLMSAAHNVNVKMNNKTIAEIEVANSAGIYIADVAVYNNYQQFQYVTKGLFADVLELEGLNLDAPYWDQNIQEQLMVGDSLYMVEGDFSFVDQLRKGVFLVNSDVYKAQGHYDTYGSPYQLVDKGDWTMDVLFEMSTGMYKDNNDNGVEDESDTYGIICGTGLVWALYSGSGMQLMASKHGEMELLISDPSYWNTTYSAIEKIVDKCVGNNDVATPELWTNSSNIWADASTAFENGRALFRYTALSAALRLTNTDCTFGLLPVPKYTQDQTEYYTIASPKGVHHGGILSAIPDKAVSAEIFDALCYYSRYGGNASLYDAYFETFRLNKFCGTPDDLRMLELMYDTTFYDLDYAANITEIPGVHIYNIEKSEDKSALYSTLYNALNAAQTRLETFKSEVAALKS